MVVVTSVLGLLQVMGSLKRRVRVGAVCGAEEQRLPFDSTVTPCCWHYDYHTLGLRQRAAQPQQQGSAAAAAVCEKRSLDDLPGARLGGEIPTFKMLPPIFSSVTPCLHVRTGQVGRYGGTLTGGWQCFSLNGLRWIIQRSGTMHFPRPS